MDTFASIIAERDAYSDSSWAILRALQEQFNAACATEWRKHFKGKRFRLDKIADIPGYDSFRAPWQERADSMYAERKANLDAYNARLGESASAEAIPQTAELQLCYKISGGMYATQGYGANTYARNDAQQWADRAEHHGLKAEVREIGRTNVGGQYPWTMIEYGVFANTDVTGWQMVAHCAQTRKGAILVIHFATIRSTSARCCDYD